MAVMTYAEAGAAALAAAMRDDPRIVALGEDLGRGGIFGQYKGLLAEFGAERVIDTPISEATIVGAGVGMALAGLKPVVEMRVADFALCAMDEIVNSLNNCSCDMPKQGTFEVDRTIRGEVVTIRGAVVNGVIRISTAGSPPGALHVASANACMPAGDNETIRGACVVCSAPGRPAIPKCTLATARRSRCRGRILAA